MLVAEVQEQQAIIAKQQKMIDDLYSKIKHQEMTTNALMSKIELSNQSDD